MVGVRDVFNGMSGDKKFWEPKFPITPHVWAVTTTPQGSGPQDGRVDEMIYSRVTDTSRKEA